MTKKEFISALKEKGISDAKSVYETFIEVIVDGIKDGDDVVLHGIGTFKVANKEARVGRNPQTGATIQIPAKKALSFKVSKTIKDAINS